MIIQNRSKSGYFLVRACARRVFPEESRRRKIMMAGAALAGAAAVILLTLLPLDGIIALPSRGLRNIQALFSQNSERVISKPLAQTEIPTIIRAQLAPSEFTKPSRVESESKPVLAEKIAEPQKNEKMIPVAESETVDEPAKTEKVTKIEETIRVAAVVDPAPDDSHTISTPASAPSTILGQITLRRDETLSKIIQRVYGNFNSKYFKSLILANPDIEDPDRVEVGQIISLPAITVAVRPVTQPLWWVKVDESDLLEDAFNILRNYPDSLPSMRLIPYWTPEEGSRFSVVLHRLYKDELSARNQMERLPAGLLFNSRVVSAWDMKSVYFADPYFGRKH